MPSNKKKRGRAKKIAMKDKLAAQAQDAAAGGGGSDNTSAVQPHPSPFALPETPSKTLQRVLGYKFVCDMNDDRPIRITPLDGDDDKFLFTNLDSGESSDVTAAFLEEKMYNLLPDYDRDSAAFPISRKLIERELPSISKDLSRKVMKLYDSVPEAERDVFMKFVDRGEGITVSVSYVRAEGILAFEPLGMVYTYKVDLVGAGNGENSFVLSTRDGGLAYEFVGGLEAHCLQRYHKELALLLMKESLARLSLGTAELSKDIRLNSSAEVFNALTEALEHMYFDMKRWNELMSLRASRFERVIKSKASLQRVGEVACSLGEALEACGHNSKAALIYAECGKYFYDAKHPKAATLLGNAGLAWKRHGDWGRAESFYAASIEATRFIHDPIQYHGTLFMYLRNLWILWHQTEGHDGVLERLVGTLRELIIGAGEPSPADGKDQHYGFRYYDVRELRDDLCNMSEENLCRVLKSIAERSVSVDAMRGAIKSCSNPNACVWAFTCDLSNQEHKKTGTGKSRSREGKDAAREYIINGKVFESSFIATCAACGESKNAEKAFMKCSAW